MGALNSHNLRQAASDLRAATRQLFTATDAAHRPLDALDQLVEDGKIHPARALAARALARRSGAKLADVVIRRHLASAADFAKATATVEGCQFCDLSAHAPAAHLVRRLGAERGLRLGVIPWQLAGKTTLIAASSKADFDRAFPELHRLFGSCALVIAPRSQIVTTLTRMDRYRLVKRAEARVNPDLSCRSLTLPRWRERLFVTLTLLSAAVIAAPVAVIVGLTLWAVLTLIMGSFLKLAALIAARRPTTTHTHFRHLSAARLPAISLLVPLFQEKDIASALVTRLCALNYARERLEVILVTESDDITTQETLARTDLPIWMRVISVPEGSVKTKPRAMNYALDHCQGTIIGVYDAEDAPEPNQLLKVAAGFATAAPDVACLQGALDFYNPNENWLSRCFTIEYAVWFRVILPGLERLGLPIPLGGTTIFFRRNALTQLQGWDAHNVTEDADLGVRLARAGYRTALIDTTTYEEANNRAWPWVKQRSRWLKGYGVTYAVHMRAPWKLLRDLGAWRFFGFQCLFLATVSQFLLAPLLWSFWLVAFGLPHPVADTFGPEVTLGLVALFITAELINLICAAKGVSRAGKAGLIPWTPTLMAYFPLATLAIYKGFAELFHRPFYWDKTAHGHSSKAIPRPRRASDGW